MTENPPSALTRPATDNPQSVSYDTVAEALQTKARVVICGSRKWTGALLENAIYGALVEMDVESTIIVTGAAKGADTVAALIARQLGFVVEEYPADWKRWGHSAGFRRNETMCHLPGVCLVLAFWDGSSRGTGDTIRRAKDMGLPVTVYTRADVEAVG